MPGLELIILLTFIFLILSQIDKMVEQSQAPPAIPTLDRINSIIRRINLSSNDFNTHQLGDNGKRIYFDQTNIKYYHDGIEEDGKNSETIDVIAEFLPGGLIIDYTDRPAVRAGSSTDVEDISNHKVLYNAGLLKGLESIKD